MRGDAAEAEGLELLARAGERMVVGVAAALPAWAERQAGRILEAWGQHDQAERALVTARARAAGEAAAARVVAELTALLALDPGDQRLTPLQVVRTAYREVTAVLREAGIPPVVRDEFDERTLPDDDYDLAPRSLADLGDERLGAVQVAWGAAKARVHKARRG